MCERVNKGQNFKVVDIASNSANNKLDMIKIMKVAKIGYKTLWEKEKMVLTSIFPISQNGIVFSGFFSRQIS